MRIRKSSHWKPCSNARRPTPNYAGAWPGFKVVQRVDAFTTNLLLEKE